MKCFVLTFFVLALVYGSQSHRGLASLQRQVVTMGSELWDKILDPRWNEVNESNSQGPDVAIAKAFNDFDQTLKGYEKDDLWKIGSPIERWWAWIKLSSEQNVINLKYEAFRAFIKRQAVEATPSPHVAWINLAESITNNLTSSIPTVADRMHNIVLHGHFFSQVLKESNDHVCELQQSKHQLLSDMYESLLLTEVKGYAMMQFSWMILKLYGKGNFTHEADMARQRYEDRTAITLASFKSTLTGVGREIWRCDPTQHVEGETYVQITRLLQGYIENEVDMNSDGTCRENCAYYQHTKNYGCFKEQFCSRQPACQGKIHSCRYVDSDMTICIAPKQSNRRYEWVEYENGQVYGKKKWCPRGTSKVDSWWRWLFWHCSYCLCICDQSGYNSDRFFSLSEVKSNVTSNKVIVGLRFVKKGRIIHLQISEGVILPGGAIDKKTIKWRPIEQLDARVAKRGVDFHQLSYEERGVDLDDLEGPAGHVLTGIRFRKIGSHLNFEIQTMPFNYQTGQLDHHKHLWISNDNTDVSLTTPRSILTLYKPDIPTNTLQHSVIDSKHDQYINFEHTDFNADFAQTTVPFIDVQEVMSRNPVALSGAGIYHKGRPQYGGFIAPKIFTVDFTSHLEDPNELEKDGVIPA